MSAAPSEATNNPSKVAKPNGVAGDDTPAPTAVDRQPSKSEAILKLLRRKRGATLAELQAATGWQAHSVRGFLSGTVRKRLKLALTTEPSSDGVRRYIVAKS